MKTDQSLRLENAAVLIAWAGLIGWLTANGAYVNFLRPGLWILLLWTFLILGLFSWAMLRQISLRNKEHLEFSSYVKLGTLILPLFFILMAQEQSLGSYALLKKGGIASFSDMQSAASGSAPLPHDGKASILQIVENLEEWKGEHIITEGMVYHDDNVPFQHFVLYRFLMLCCAADAMPLGLFVETANAEALEQDTWVRVQGRLSIQTIGGMDSAHIKAKHISRVDAPSDRYLYPRLW